MSLTAAADSQEGMTTAAEESQDTPDASLADTQEDQDKEDTAAAGKKKKGKQKKQPKAKLPIFTGASSFDWYNHECFLYQAIYVGQSVPLRSVSRLLYILLGTYSVGRRVLRWFLVA